MKDIKFSNGNVFAGNLAPEFIFLPSNDRRISEAITGVAKQNNITQIVLGQSARSRWEEIWKGSIVNSMMRHTDGIDIHIVSDDKTSN